VKCKSISVFLRLVQFSRALNESRCIVNFDGKIEMYFYLTENTVGHSDNFMFLLMFNIYKYSLGLSKLKINSGLTAKYTPRLCCCSAYFTSLR